MEESSRLIIDFFSKEGLKLLADNGVKKPILEVDSIYCLEFNREHIGCFYSGFPIFQLLSPVVIKTKKSLLTTID
jgi:hypothetical protein